MEVLGGSIDALTDDNLADILVRLDAVSVLRCRAVCKIWRRVATDRSFLAAHAAARRREMIVETKYGYARSTVPLSPTDDDIDTTTAAGDDDDGHHHRYLFDPSRTPADADGISSEFELCASLDGLLVLQQWLHKGASSIISDRFTYVICNPVTRQWANLSVPVPRRRACDYSCAAACGFYLHASSGEYHLLVHCASGPCPELERYWCIVSVGSAHMPRRLPHAPPSEDFPYYYPVSHRGTLHWLSAERPEGSSSSTGKMLAFDTVSETFRLMPRPPVTEKMSHLLELDGELSVASIYRDDGNRTMLDIWALQDYEAEKWTLRHRLKVQRPPRLSAGGGWKRPIIMACGSSAILVGYPQTSVVMVYSLKDKKVRRKINFGSVVTFTVFSESLVPHAFFDSPDTLPLKFSNPLFNASSCRSSCKSL